MLLRLLSLSFVGVVVVACSSSDVASSTSNADASTAGNTACADVCTSAERCGVTADLCASTCSSLSQTERKCIANAADCSALQRCSTGTTPDSGAADTGRPTQSTFTCDSESAIHCKTTEYCAQDTKHSAGCYPIPAGCTTCDCVKADALAHYPMPSGSNPYVCSFATCAESGGGFHISCH